MKILNRTAIKMEARGFIKLDNKWIKMFLATLFINLFTADFSGIIKVIEKSTWLNYNIVSKIIFVFNTTWVISLILLPFVVAIGGYYLNHIRGFNPQWDSLYKEGASRYGRYFAVQFLSYVYTFLWALLFVIPGIIMSLAYSQARYIIHDNPNLTASQAIQMSKIMTNGFKSDLFVLHLSFIGWYLLSVPTFGLMLIYVIPYVETTSAMYYENLKRFAIDSGKIAPEAFGMISVAPPANDFDENTYPEDFR